MFFSDRSRRDSNDGKGVDKKYIPWVVTGGEILKLDRKLVNDRYRYRISDISGIGKVEDIGLSVFAADPIHNMHFITWH